MKKLLPGDETVNIFEIARNKYKRNPGFYKDHYKDVSAQVLVRLNVLEMDCRDKIKQMERESLKVNNSLSVRPKNEKDQEVYDDLVRKLKHTKCLKDLL